jgi:HK97 family phage major capsid protein
MAKKATELLQERAKLIEDARALHTKADAEKRELTAEEKTQFDQMLKDSEARKADADRDLALERAEQSLEAGLGRRTEPDAGDDDQAILRAEERSVDLAADRNRRLSPKEREERSDFSRWLATGRAQTLQVDNTSAGGALAAPVVVVNELIQRVDEILFFRQLATVYGGINGSLGAVSLDTDIDDADWTSELATPQPTDLKLGGRELKPNPLSKEIRVSNKLLRTSQIDAAGLVLGRLAYKLAVPQEKAYFVGTGSGQPLGIFTASANGVPTTRDVSTGNTTTAVTMDGLKAAKYALKVQYWSEAGWLNGTDLALQVATLKDTTNNYLWQPSVVVGEPDQLLGFPMRISAYAPATFTAGKYVAALAALKSGYWIADGQTVEIQRLDQIEARNNRTVFIARTEVDGMPVLAECFVRVKLAP